MRDMAAQNLALGSKLLLNIVSGNPSWSKKVLWKKYFHGQRLRCLDQPPRITKGSSVFKLCLTAMKHFSHKLYWISGNGKKIRIWEDSILGDQPFNQMVKLENIRAWLQASNLETLWDISRWINDAEILWGGWNLEEVPHWLDGEANLLLDFLQGKSPLKASSKDKRGWGSLSGSY